MNKRNSFQKTIDRGSLNIQKIITAKLIYFRKQNKSNENIPVGQRSFVQFLPFCRSPKLLLRNGPAMIYIPSSTSAKAIPLPTVTHL